MIIVGINEAAMWILIELKTLTQISEDWLNKGNLPLERQDDELSITSLIKRL